MHVYFYIRICFYEKQLQTLIKDNVGGVADYSLTFAIAGIAIVYLSIQFGMDFISDKLWNVFKDEVIFQEAESSVNTVDENSKVALAVLLLQVSGADQEYSDQEIKVSYQILEHNFSIKDQEAKEILKKANHLRNDKFIIDQLLSQNFTIEEKQQLFSSVWQIIAADKKITKPENGFALKLKKRLELPSKLVEDVKSQYN